MYDSVAEVFSILATSRSCGNIHCFYQHYQPGKITLHYFSELMIEYLVTTSDQLWMIKYMLYFVALMTIAAEIVVEKSSICVW